MSEKQPFVNMKTIRLTMDEALLNRLDSDKEARRDGRSAVLRRALDEYLRRRPLAERYRNAYAGGTGLGPELSGWAGQGEWPAS